MIASNPELSIIVHEVQILVAIDKLHRQKVRVDAKRICNYVLRHFSVDARETIADLRQLIEREVVIGLNKKGGLSYRKASEWSCLQQYKNRPEGFVRVDSSMVASAFAELLLKEPNYLDQGVPAARLVEQLLVGISNPTSRKVVQDFLAKEVSRGHITRMSTGNYSLVGTSHVSSSSTSSQLGKEETGTPRRCSSETGDSGKDSLNKESNSNFFGFDENENCDSRSDNTPSSSRQASPKDDGKKDVVDFVKEEEKKVKVIEEKVVKTEAPAEADGAKVVRRSNKSVRKQRLLVRSDDSMDLEMKFDEFEGKEEQEVEKEDSEEKEDEESGRSSNNQSPTAGTIRGMRSARRKRVKIVFDPSDSNAPKRRRVKQPGASTAPAQQEVVESPAKVTTKEEHKKFREARPETLIIPSQSPPVLSPQVSPTPTSTDQVEGEVSPRAGIDPNIPDASNWTSEQVYQYFARLFPKEAEVFRVQDIDGSSLLLMKRIDILKGLDLLLGPALKIYRHVLKLQLRRDDTRFYWL